MDLAYIDTIPTEEFIQRRTALFAQMPENSALLIFSAQEQQRNADCHYPFRQDSSFWYLTGFNEPDSALLMVKKSGKASSSLFLREKDPLMETWNGRRLGTKAAPHALSIEYAYDIKEFTEIYPQLSQDIGTLMYCATHQKWADSHVQALSLPTSLQLTSWKPIVDEMRLFKSHNEAMIMQRAAEISAFAHIKAMQQARANRFEYELESEILSEFNRHGARYPSYNTIVASGNNANILHYTENDQQLKDGDLVLIDAGCELSLYAGDITRTFPVNGKFSEPQKAIYNIVLQAQKRAIELLIPGSSIQQANDEVVKIMLKGLLELGIVEGDIQELIDKSVHREFYMHGLGHWLGLDVHDCGDYGVQRSRKLEAGMVITVEPGLYLAADNTNIPEQYRGIGVRIEDDLLITEDGNKNLTVAAPKEIADIEELMQQQNS